MMPKWELMQGEVRVDAGPGVGGRLAAVVEAGPDERTREERPGRKVRPPLLGGRSPGRGVDVIGGDVALLPVVGVDAAGADGAGLLTAEERLERVCLVEGIDAPR